MPRARILHILTDTNIGGAGKYVLSLADWADAHEEWRGCLEIALPPGSALKPAFEARSVPVTEVPYINDISFHPKAVSRLYHLIQAKKPDVAHTHAALSGRAAAKLAGRVRIVSTRHSVFPVSVQETRFPRRQVTGWLNSALSDIIIAVSPAALDNLKAIGVDPAIVRVIYNGACPVAPLPPEKRAEVRKTYGIPPNAFVVSMIARMTDVKGHGTALDAAQIIGRQDRSVVFLFAGTGPLESQIRERARAENAANVICAGFVQEISALENITDVQINASYGTEATSIALLEGMSLGIPAVASDFGGNPYVIENGVNGLIFPQKDSEALARAVLALKHDMTLYKNMSHRAKQIFQDRFTLEVMGRKTFELYQNLTEDMLGGR